MRLDGRKRVRGGIATTVGALAEAEGLRPVPAPLSGGAGGVAHGEQPGPNLLSRQRLFGAARSHGGACWCATAWASSRLEVVTDTGVVLARHRRAPDGAGAVVCAAEHVAALEKVVLANFADRPPCRRKHRRPPTAEALAEADRIRGATRRRRG